MSGIALDAGAAALLRTLHEAGYGAYAVGGCVRDSLLGLVPHDWDLCTSALPQQVLELFGPQNCIPTGLQHGTVTIKYGGNLYETTTFRTEGSYSDGRHPDEVHFVPDVRADLARRDFTINAMAYSAEEGLIDPFGGQADLQASLVRAVGQPQHRFEEDALRILRLYRFAARFGFALDPATAAAARALAPHLDCVSAERIAEELCKLLAAPAPGAYLEPAVLQAILPQLTPQALEAAKPVVDACPRGAEHLPVRLAALLMSLGEDGTRAALKRLRCSNACIEEAAVLVREAEAEAQQELSPQTRIGPFHRPPYCPAGNRVPPQRTVFGETPAVLPGKAPGGSMLSMETGGRAGSFSEDFREVGPRREALGRDLGPGLSEEKAPGTPDLTIRIRLLLGRSDLKTVQRLAALGAALEPEHSADFAAQAELAEELEADGVCCRVSQLAVNGRDLMAAGIPAGPGLRRVLEALLDAVIRDEVPNERAALLQRAREFSAS